MSSESKCKHCIIPRLISCLICKTKLSIEFLNFLQDEVTRKKIEKVSLETIIQIKGTVLARPKDMINSKLSTGEIEVLIDDIKVLNHASDLPFNIRGFQKPKEAMRMQYRYLDLRFPEMQKNLRERSNLLFKVRQFLVNSDFVDVETPTLFKATPGVSVPSYYLIVF